VFRIQSGESSPGRNLVPSLRSAIRLDAVGKMTRWNPAALLVNIFGGVLRESDRHIFQGDAHRAA